MRCAHVLLLVLVGAHAPAQSLDDLTRTRDAASGRASSSAPEDWSNADNRWLPGGGTIELASIAGPGVVRHIWLTFPDPAPSWIAPQGSATPDELVLRMYWDGAEHPAVESPLGDFFAAGFGRRAEVVSVPVQVQGGDSYNCFWPMPFFRSARITLTNESSRVLAALYYQIDYTSEPSLAPDSAYFCAMYRQEFPTRMGEDYLLADIHAPEGGGHYVGTALSVRSRSPQWFGEGDDKFFIDGDTSPTIRGTGTEDYFLNAWGMQQATLPSFGVSRCDGWLAELGDSGTMYRWHIADPVRFRRSLRVTLEHKGWISGDETTTGRVEGHVEREDDFASVAFWYQRGQPAPFPAFPGASERKLPAIDAVVEGAALLDAARHEGGELSLQAGGLWTGQGQLFFAAGKPGAWLEFGFDVPDDRPRALAIPVTRSYDFGVYRVLLDGQELTPSLDCYSPETRLVELRAGDGPIAPGRHTLRFECVGVNPNSTGVMIGIDCVRLRQRHDRKRPPLGP